MVSVLETGLPEHRSAIFASFVLKEVNSEHGRRISSIRNAYHPRAFVLWNGGFRSLCSCYPFPLAAGALANGNGQLMPFQASWLFPFPTLTKASFRRAGNENSRSLSRPAVFSRLRKKGDSNPRYPVKGIPVFETSAFSHSAILPLGTAKII